MQTRNFDWFDTRAMRPVYSFQVKHEGRWCNVHDNGKPCFFDNEAERDKARASMRKQPEKESP